MESEWNYTESDIAQKFLFFNVLKDGRVHIFTSLFEKSPPSNNPISIPNVETKDVQISTNVSARLFRATSTDDDISTTEKHKLPLLFYVHGGGFCMQSAFSMEYTRFVSLVVAEANIMAISVEYSLFPKRHIPACYDDCWAALQWVASHCKDMVSEHQVGYMGLSEGAKIEGMILIHPFFWEGEKMWMYMCPTNEGPRDRRLIPDVEDLARIGCGRVLVFVAEKDVLYDAGNNYVDELIKSGWKGKMVEIMVNKDKEHCFHLYDYLDPEAFAIRRGMSSFINHQDHNTGHRNN
ncbi:probable carboxylesterase 2 [Beta vulgaris subsp. vulgaris]|uniref:probable carboxylesterase 2 n=1 Tax=Beta vulgaris subsp. vulgaris TaxID=3555 RepID=UPI0020366753|nr:probable carboxylesterase 2 [Beta vulgaris subsp. vulgaris]